MPRTVHVNDRNDRRDKIKPNDAPGDTGFFGMRRLWATSGSNPSPEAEPAEPTPLVSLDEPRTDEVLFSLPVEVPSPENLEQTIATSPEPYGLANQILAKVVPREIVRETGSVEFDLLFESAQLPAVTVNADHAVHVLKSIPADLPLHVKQLLVKTSLSVMTNLVQENSVSQDIVSDAARKMLWIARLQENIAAEMDAQRENTREEIAILEAAIAAKNRELADAESRATAALQSCRQRTDELHNVTLFFDHQDGGSSGDENKGGAPPDGTANETRSEELPPHLREDSVLRLLGLHDVAEMNGDDSTDLNIPLSPVHRNGIREYA
jgi:hypothetical protein